ncbi:MAG: hypothetical protein IT361_17850 [Gemmatimonadaceae bacterium]|nr:hypothetical protein [Gemmatimonadaceae bacterium]
MTRQRLVAAFVVLFAAACSRGGAAHLPAPAIPTLPVPAPDTAARAKEDSLPMVPVVLPPHIDSVARPATPDRPAQRCTLDFENTPETRLQSVKDPISQKYTSYIGGGFVGVCRRQNIHITSDSAESYEQNRLYYLIGRVKYREDRVSLDADRLTYFQADERLLAEGNVVVTMRDSSSMTGPRAEYWRAVRGVRPASRIHATARPTLRMYETDSLGRRQREPVRLVADNIIGEGETLFVAHGRVELDRADLAARSDSAVLDNVRQYSRLLKEPIVESKGSQPFTLTGKVIDIFGRTRRVDRVLSVDSAKAVNKDLTLTAQTLDLRVNDNKLQRAYAFGPGRAVAVTRDRRIVADSLDVHMPSQRIRELHAIGDAYADSDPDSTKIATKERDWLRGAAIVAHFDSVVRDTTAQPRIIDLVADGNASSFYQIPANDGDREKPGINYVRGRRITVDFKAQDVSTVTVVDSVAGVFLEAAPVDTLPPDPRGRRRPTTRRPPATPTAARRPPSPGNPE